MFIDRRDYGLEEGLGLPALLDVTGELHGVVLGRNRVLLGAVDQAFRDVPDTETEGLAVLNLDCVDDDGLAH